jgi:hypothetical protein
VALLPEDCSAVMLMQMIRRTDTIAAIKMIKGDRARLAISCCKG